jgi:peptidoglycan/LPS O-acetylase OafA/YrhL
VLSGFLLYLPVAAWCLGRGPRPRTGRFVRNRLLRIFPAYWVITVLVLVAGGVAGYSLGKLLAAGTLSNAFFGFAPPIQPAWSLTPELAFYVYLAIVMLVLPARPVAAWVPPAMSFLVGIVAFGVLQQNHVAFDAILYTPLTIFHSALMFAIGMSVAVAAVRLAEHRVETRVQTALVLVAMALFTVSFPLRGRNYLLADAAIGFGSGALLAAITLPVRSVSLAARPLIALLNLPPARWLGRISYSFYLVHQPLLFWTVAHVRAPVPLAAAHVIAGVLSFLLAWLSYRFVERPALALKERWH